jgi:hypothetical protein
MIHWLSTNVDIHLFQIIVNRKIFCQILSGYKLLICYEISIGTNKLRSFKKYVNMNGCKDVNETKYKWCGIYLSIFIKQILWTSWFVKRKKNNFNVNNWSFDITYPPWTFRAVLRFKLSNPQNGHRILQFKSVRLPCLKRSETGSAQKPEATVLV